MENRKLELRIYYSPKFDEGDHKTGKGGIVTGVKDYLITREIPFSYSGHSWKEIGNLINSSINEGEYPINSGLNQINAEKAISGLAKRSIGLAHEKPQNHPHWNLIITPDILNSNDKGTVYGKSSNYIHGKDSFASIIVSTHGLSKLNPLLNEKLSKLDPLLNQKAFILGNHYALLTEGECYYEKCIGSAIDSKKLEKLARDYKKNHTIPF